jgi:PleD family two-component response regulator
VTVSAGVASMSSQGDVDVLSAAMEALAEAKAAGTGRIAIN